MDIIALPYKIQQFGKDYFRRKIFLEKHDLEHRSMHLPKVAVTGPATRLDLQNKRHEYPSSHTTQQ